jgi:preprotein translocase subunit SecY
MFETFFQKVKIAASDKQLRTRVLFLLGALAVFRLLAAIPIPSVDPAQLQGFLQNNQFFGLLNVFSGGGLSHLSIVMLGVGPYITSSIIMQLSTIMSPRLKALYQEEGEIGRKKFTQYSRLLTIPLALIQAFSFLLLLSRQGVIGQLSPFEFVVNIAIFLQGAYSLCGSESLLPSLVSVMVCPSSSLPVLWQEFLPT